MPSKIKQSEIKSTGQRRSGYVLLAVLAVIVLMVTVLATLSKTSLRRALAAADAQLRLQQRLGADSIERTVLPKAATVFDRLEEQAKQTRIQTGQFVPIPRQIRDAITLGGVTFDIILADEDAKLNLNRVYHLTGQIRTRSSVAGLIGPVASRALRLAPASRPMGGDLDTLDTSEEVVAIPRAFRSWGEVFALSDLAIVSGNQAALPLVTGEITCWGGGGLNLQRASDESIRVAAACVLSEAGADRLVSRYRENVTSSVEILVQQETNSETQRIRLRRMLGESSTHFSLWVDASAAARRSLRTFSVMRLTEEGVTNHERFSF